MSDEVLDASQIWMKLQIDDFFDGPETKQTEMFWEFLKTGKYPEDADAQIEAAGQRSLARWTEGNRQLDKILKRDSSSVTTE